MTDQETVEALVEAINGALDDASELTECQPHHLVIAAIAVAVKLAWVSAIDKSEVRPALVSMIEDFVTQSELGRTTKQ